MKCSLVILLAVCLHAGTAWAEEDRTPAPPPPLPRTGEPAHPRPGEPKLSAEDREVVENLELLESMDTAEDLDLLLELSKEE